MSSHKNKRQTYTNGSANRLGSDSSSKARFGSGLVSLGAAPKVRIACSRTDLLHHPTPPAAVVAVACIYTVQQAFQRTHTGWKNN